MKLEQEQHVQGTSRQDEEKHLKETLDVIHANMDSYGHQVQEMRESIDEMLEHFHDDNPELINLLENTITLHDHMKRALERNAKARNKPYFGRIIFHDLTLGKKDSLYIGRGGISKSSTEQSVIDWRAPIANTYYENGLGKCSYQAPDGTPMEIDLQLKRTYEIEQGQLLDYYDTEVISNDDLLTKYLSRNKQAVLGEIVATIQKEQNEIIRRSPYHNIIVQGVAGSGKTTVAMHRISYILYNYADRIKPGDFYIVGSNRILLNYITGVLPDLDVEGVRQMTMEQLFIRLLYEDWDAKKCSIKKHRQNSDKGKIKGEDSWFRDLKAYCDHLEQSLISTDPIYLNPNQFVEGFQDGRTGVFDRSETSKGNKLVLLMEGEAVKRYINQNPTVSIQNKINMLNERLMIKIKDEFLAKGVKYTEAERKAIMRAYRNRYGGKAWKLSTFQLYRDFVKKQIAKGLDVEIPGSEFDVYDLAALAYIYKRTKETEVISEAHHIVIDEAQDFGMMVYDCLHFCITGCTYTIMGDVSQNIHFGFGLNDWEALKKLFLPDEMDSFGILKKSYRNTVEISNFATKILQHGTFKHYPIEPIIRHGEQVILRQIEDACIWRDAAEICRKWQDKGFGTIAIVCKDQESANQTVTELGKHIELMDNDLDKMEFGNGIMVLPVEYIKGLEFDAVLILNPTRKEYPVDDGHAKLLYVAATRALHELCILHSGDLTGLIADPVPERVTDTSTPLPTLTKKKPVVVRREITTEKPKAAKSQPAKPTPVRTSQEKVPEKPMPAKQPLISGKNPRIAPAFGDMPATEKLRPLGHTKIDLSVRWVMKQSDGLYLQSRYGVLRISPVSSSIIRITFAKGNKILDLTHPSIAVQRVERFWTYKESAGTVDLSTDELTIQVNKSTGAIMYMTRSKGPLLAESAKECRQIENQTAGKHQAWLYLDYTKKEQLYAVGTAEQNMLSLRGTARYISREGQLPFLFSDRGYGLLIASDGPVISCDLPGKGSFIYTENQVQMDYYFTAAKNSPGLLNAYRYLCGLL